MAAEIAADEEGLEDEEAIEINKDYKNNQTGLQDQRQSITSTTIKQIRSKTRDDHRRRKPKGLLENALALRGIMENFEKFLENPPWRGP